MEVLNQLGHALLTGITFLIVITVLVFFHELGHYWVAKACGMHVDAFAVMMGGVRKTDLRDKLKRPLASSAIIWAVGSVIAILAIIGAMTSQQWLFMSAASLLAFVGPFWVISRLSHLYHTPIQQGIGTLLKSWAVAFLVLAFGTKLHNVDFGYAIGLFLAASATAVLIVYYFPVINKAEGSKMGEGMIEMDGNPVNVSFRPLWSKTNKEGTEFSLLLLPLGGFAAISGMHPKEDGSEIHVENGFFSKAPLKRLATLFAGPLFSFILGVALVFIVFIGRGEPYGSSIVDTVAEESPAAKAGIQPKDKIVSINGTEIADFDELTEEVRFSYTEAGEKPTPKPLLINYFREGVGNIAVSVTPVISDEPEEIFKEGKSTGEKKYIARLGVTSAMDYKPIPAGEAAVRAVALPYRMSVDVIKAFTSLKKAQQTAGGPGAIVSETSDAVESGIWRVLLLAGSLSISLGVLNLLPFPPLDGGQMVVAFIEMLRGNKRLSLKTQSTLQAIGMGLVAFMMLFAFTVDAGRSSDKSKPEDMFKKDQSSESAAPPESE
ncbi:MAG: site-2 protease family protein [Armatimonadetes bacterium]|nr:site-2 protease family protein [Armatimonadota bacterium]